MCLRTDWSFENLFGRPIRHSCPVASSSHIQVDLSNEDEEKGYSLEPKTSEIQLPTDTSAIYDLNTSEYAQTKTSLCRDVLTHQPFFQVALPLSLHMRWPVMRPEGFEYRALALIQAFK